MTRLFNILDESLLEFEQKLTEGDERLINEANTAYDKMVDMLDEINELREMLSGEKLSHQARLVANQIIDEMSKEIPFDEYRTMLEKVERQFRRYSGQDTLKRQYRCTTGQKAGRIVTSPEKCGIRKDPMAVRRGKKASRMKKGQRVRKTQFTKRKTASKRLVRLNKAMGGDK
jgi:hypothetical protein